MFRIHHGELLGLLGEGRNLPVRLGTTFEHLNQTGRTVQVRFSSADH